MLFSAYKANTTLPHRYSESDFRRQVLALAQLCGWKCYFTWTSIRSPAGFPDFCLVRDRVLFAELKTAKGKVTPAQQEWLDALRAAGQEVYVWRPEDLLEIAEVLRRR